MSLIGTAKAVPLQRNARVDLAMAGRKVEIDRLFHALGDRTRREILERVGERPVSVSELAGPLKITLTAVMQHLQVLEEAGLVRTEKLGRVRTCRIETTGLNALEAWIRERRPAWERKLDRLGEMLREEDEAEGEEPEAFLG